jgi:hypothetical protein
VQSYTFFVIVNGLTIIFYILIIHFNTFASYNKYLKMKLVGLLILSIFITCNLFAQECKVLKAEISSSYQGECKNGLANGKGIAKGQDSYEGEFSKGLPDGTGTYVWSNGANYKGKWRKGMRDGKGTYVWHTAKGDSTLVGVWRQDKYEGTGITPYHVSQNESISRYSISKGIGKENIIVVKVMRGGTPLSNINLAFSMTSGSDYTNGPYHEIKNWTTPFDVRITFTVPNLLNTYSYNCIFEVTINEIGPWDITLNM